MPRSRMDAVDEAVDESVDLATAASILAVHYQTAYRWVRSGTLPARVEKGMYRIQSRDIESLLADRRASAGRRARRSRPSATFTDRSRRRLLAALVTGDETETRSIGRRVAAASSITVLLDEVVAPAMKEIGCRWRAGTLPVWSEHRATAIVGRLLGDLTFGRPGRRRGTAVVTTVEGDRHALPAEMAVAALRDDGWRVHHLGIDLPADDLVDFCRVHAVELLVITVTTESPSEKIDEVHRLVVDLVSRVLVGGPGRLLVDLQRLARTRGQSRRPQPR